MLNNFLHSVETVALSVMSMGKIGEVLPLLLPVVIIELLLALVALIHVLRHDTYRFGNKVVWILIVLFVGIIGPVVYFVFGKGENE